MQLPGNARSVVADAPGGLELVQELLNTAEQGTVNPRAELLVDLESARRWNATVLASVGRTADDLDAAGLQHLLDLRDAIRAAVHERDGRPAAPRPVAADLALRLDESGEVGATGGLDGLVLAEILVAQARGDWPRLKLCALAVCDVAFYDRSRNTSGRYHTARCANLVNLRSSRQRRAG